DNGAAAKQKEKESPVAVGQEAPPATPESEKPSTPMEKGAKKEAAKKKEKAEPAPKRNRSGALSEKGKGKAATSDSGPKGPIKLKRSQVVMFTEELSEMLGAGLQLESALRVMEGREELSAMKDVTILVRKEVREGASFSKALEKTSPSFGPLFCSMAHAGEVSGALPKILRRQAEYLNTIADLQSKVLFALIYPAFLVAAGVGVTVLFVVYLIPQLMGLIDSTGGELPTAAKLLMGTSDFIKAYWWAMILMVVAAVVAFRMWLRNRKNQETWDRFIVHAPMVGGVLSSRFYVQCMETLANLVGNGMPLLKGLELTRDTTMNLFLKEKVSQVAGIVGEGGSLSRAMKKVGYYPALLIDMVAVGEQTGDIESALVRSAARYDKELSKTIDKISALIQPVIVFVMAGVVGTMAYLMISIIFDTVSGLGSQR
ncbi:MAG: general secretion pathway protein F, partial [Verrucomicrobiales bacterium]